MKKMILMLVISLLAVSLSIAAQTRRKATPRKPAKATINLQAGLVYQQTGPEMLARITFYLLDDDLISILQNAGIGPSLTELTKEMNEINSKIDASATAENRELAAKIRIKNPNLRYPLLEILRSTDVDKLGDALRPHIRTTIKTDFKGGAQIFDFVPGTYYVYGFAQTHDEYGGAAWNLKVEIKAGQNDLILDQSNMVVGSR